MVVQEKEFVKFFICGPIREARCKDVTALDEVQSNAGRCVLLYRGHPESERFPLLFVCVLLVITDHCFLGSCSRQSSHLASHLVNPKFVNSRRGKVESKILVIVALNARPSWNVAK